MAVSADHNEIIELTDLIEKGPGLPDGDVPASGPLPLPVEDAAPGAPEPEAPVMDSLPSLSGEDTTERAPAPAAPEEAPLRDWEAQLDASAAAIGDAGLRLAALARQDGPLPLPEEDTRLDRLENMCRTLERRLDALEEQVPAGHGGENLLMETAERLTRLEEQLRARPDGDTPLGGGMAGAPDSVLLMESMERLAALEQGGQDMERRLNALEEQAPAGHGEENLLMETAERLTHLEERLQARPDGDTPLGGGMAGAPDGVLLMESMERLAALEQGGQDMERRLNELEGRLPAGHGGETLLMETAERLTRLEERLQALWARQEAPVTAAPAAGETTALEQRVAALEHQLGDLMTDFDKYVEKAAAAAAARILHEEIRRLMAERT